MKAEGNRMKKRSSIALRFLSYLGKLRPGPLRLDTPTGSIGAAFALDGSVSLDGEPETARAHVLLDGTMVVEADDPYGWGMPPV